MTGEDEQVVGVDQAFLGVGVEEVVGMPDDELVQRGAGGHENADGAGAPTRAAKLLPGGRDRAGVSDEDRCLEAADVDAELEGVGADDSGDVTGAKSGLDLPPVKREVAGAVSAHALARVEARR